MIIFLKNIISVIKYGWFTLGLIVLLKSSKSKVGGAYSLSVTYEKPSGSFRLTWARLLCSGTLLMGRSILTKFLAWGAAEVHIFAKE